MTPRHSEGDLPPDVLALLDAARAETAAKRAARQEAEALLLEGARARMRKRQMRERFHSVALIAIIAMLWGIAALVWVRGDFLPQPDAWRDHAKPFSP